MRTTLMVAVMAICVSGCATGRVEPVADAETGMVGAAWRNTTEAAGSHPWITAALAAGTAWVAFGDPQQDIDHLFGRDDDDEDSSGASSGPGLKAGEGGVVVDVSGDNNIINIGGGEQSFVESQP